MSLGALSHPDEIDRPKSRLRKEDLPLSLLAGLFTILSLTGRAIGTEVAGDTEGDWVITRLCGGVCGGVRLIVGIIARSRRFSRCSLAIALASSSFARWSASLRIMRSSSVSSLSSTELCGKLFCVSGLSISSPSDLIEIAFVSPNKR